MAECQDPGSTHCTISLEKLLDRAIQHAELIYLVSENSLTLFVSTPYHKCMLNMGWKYNNYVFYCSTNLIVTRKKCILPLLSKTHEKLVWSAFFVSKYISNVL